MTEKTDGRTDGRDAGPGLGAGWKGTRFAFVCGVGATGARTGPDGDVDVDE
jgi:hypothetical protein